MKLMYFYRRKPGAAIEEFQSKFRSEWSENVSKIASVLHYKQCHSLLSGYKRPTPPFFDCIDEIYFNSLEDARLIEESIDTHAAVGKMPFVDSRSIVKVVCDEVVIIDGPVKPTMVKNFEFAKRKNGMAPDDFHRYWREVHGPLASKIGVIRRYVQSHVLMSEYEKEEAPVFDGIAETWFEDTDDMRKSAATSEYMAVRKDEDNFISDERHFLIAREIIIR